jgi:uncharacterized protein YwgA
MGKGRRAAVLTELARQLRRHGSWCGETHLQKATYVLQELMEVPLEFEFTLYKHGPFSFDLRDELTSLRADGLLALEPRPAPYGPTLTATHRSEELRARFTKTRATYEGEIDFVADKLAPKGVAELEKLATALWVTFEDRQQDRPARINELKPHVSIEEARAAVAELDELVSASGHD